MCHPDLLCIQKKSKTRCKPPLLSDQILFLPQKCRFYRLFTLQLVLNRCLNHTVEQVAEPKQWIKLFLVFEGRLRRSCRFFRCVCNSHDKFLESLEDGALIYSIERFMKGELHQIKLFIVVRLLYFHCGILCYENNVITESTDSNEPNHREDIKVSLHLQKSAWMITDSTKSSIFN